MCLFDFCTFSNSSNYVFPFLLYLHVVIIDPVSGTYSFKKFM